MSTIVIWYTQDAASLCLNIKITKTLISRNKITVITKYITAINHRC